MHNFAIPPQPATLSPVRRIWVLMALSALILALSGPAGRAEDKHVGYYYPTPARIETYTARAPTMEGADRRRRVGFVVAVVNQMLDRPYAPGLSFFAKGDEAEKLIIVSNRAGQLDTIYRVRALLATLTSTARLTPIFKELKVDHLFTFLDLLKMLGFTQITVSDGDHFAHQILIR